MSYNFSIILSIFRLLETMSNRISTLSSTLRGSWWLSCLVGPSTVSLVRHHWSCDGVFLPNVGGSLGILASHIRLEFYNLNTHVNTINEFDNCFIWHKYTNLSIFISIANSLGLIISSRTWTTSGTTCMKTEMNITAFLLAENLWKYSIERIHFSSFTWISPRLLYATKSSS